MVTASDWITFTSTHAREEIVVPTGDDDKYSRGVVGFVTGSERYPGAAVLGVEAAARAGAGMIRYLGPRRAEDLILARRPEATMGAGRVQSWVVGSGIDPAARGAETTGLIREALASSQPVAVDAGALGLTPAGGPCIVTPHHRELAALLSERGEPVRAANVRSDPARWCDRAASVLDATVLLKGSPTLIAAPDGERWVVAGAPAWLATAGTGDVLAGILGAVLAWHGDEPGIRQRLPRLAATAAFVHARAGAIAARRGPIAALDLADAVSPALRELVPEACEL